MLQRGMKAKIGQHSVQAQIPNCPICTMHKLSLVYPMGQSSITIQSTAHRSQESGCPELVALFEKLKIAQISIDVGLHAKNRSLYSLQTPWKRSLVWWNRLNNWRGKGCVQIWLLILGVDGNSYCNDRRDLDLCRDAALLEHDWRCVIPQCGQPYDRSWIENTLLQIVRQRERLFHLQDLVCSKCCQVHHSIINLWTSSNLNPKRKQ